MGIRRTSRTVRQKPLPPETVPARLSPARPPPGRFATRCFRRPGRVLRNVPLARLVIMNPPGQRIAGQAIPVFFSTLLVDTKTLQRLAGVPLCRPRLDRSTMAEPISSAGGLTIETSAKSHNQSICSTGEKNMIR